MHYKDKQPQYEEWETPKEGRLATKDDLTLAELVKQYDLKLDVAGTEDNKCCERVFDKKLDALTQQWDENWYLNIPGYSQDIVARWLTYGIDQCQTHQVVGVAMLPSYTGEDWYHDLVLPFASIYYLRGRVHFWKYQLPSTESSPNFYSMLAMYDFRGEI